MNKLDYYTRLMLIVLGVVLIAITVYANTARIELSNLRFNQLRSYVQKRDADWLPFIDRTGAHLDRQDAALSRLEKILQHHEIQMKSFVDRYEDSHKGLPKNEK